MSRARLSKWAAVCAVLLCIVGGYSLFQPWMDDEGHGVVQAVGPGPLITNRDGYFVNFEEAPIHPMEFCPDATSPDELWVCNIADGSVSVFDVSGADPGDPGIEPVLIKVIPVGLGPVSIRRRPGAMGKLWVVCTTSNAIFIVDEEFKIVTHVISFYDPGSAPNPKVARFNNQEPMDVAFDASGDTAYVSLSVSNMIAIVNTNTREWTTAFSFGSDFDPDSVRGAGQGVPALFSSVEEPRALLMDNGTLYGLSFESGNGSVIAPGEVDTPDAIDFDQTVGNVADLTRAGVVINTWRYWEDMTTSIHRLDPADRDILAFDPAGNPTDVTFRVGSLNYDIAKSNNVHSQSLYVSNVELHNFDQNSSATLNNNRSCGEELLATDRPMVSHRITVIEPDDMDLDSNPNAKELDPSLRTVIDLNDPAFRHQGIAASFATPTQICMAKNGKTFIVACYESANSAIIQAVDLTTGSPNKNKVIGVLKTSTGSFGPRGVLKDETNKLVYVYNRGDHTIDRFNLSGFVPGTTLDPDLQVSAGLDITPPGVVRGRSHFIDASNSVNGQQTCQSCHVDGHMDRLGWCLDNVVLENPDPGQPISTNGGALDPGSINGRRFLARKGPKVTMSLRGIEETPPFHWRGDRNDLVDFNEAFVGLLGGQKLSVPEFDDFRDYVFSLSYPPNPRQRLDRKLTIPSSKGFDQFRDVKTVDPHVERDTPRLVSCNDCHALTPTSLGGGAGTINQVINDRRTNTTFPNDVTQLRGLFDKESDPVRTGFEPPGVTLDSSHALYELPGVGFGFTNNGNLDSIRQTVDSFQDLEGEVTIKHAKITQALEQLDTGVSPALGATVFLDDDDPIQTGAANLIAEADAGQCDLVVRGWWRRDAVSPLRMIRMQYDPAQLLFLTDIDAAQQTFDPDWYDISYTLAQIEAMADMSSVDGLGDGEFAVMAVPLGMGYRLGRDRDLDLIVDRDESLVYGTSDDLLDTDLDGLPDGHEVFLVPGDITAPSNPNVTPADTSHLGVTPGSVTVGWTNSTVARLRWRTEELSTTEVDVVLRSDPSQVIGTFTESRLKLDHTIVVRGMTPGKDYTAHVRGNDPANNTATQVSHDIDLDPAGFFMGHTFIDSVVITHDGYQGEKVKFVATIQVVDENGDPTAIADNPGNPVGAGVIVEVIEWLPDQNFQYVGDPDTVLLWNVAQEAGLGGTAGIFNYSFTSLHDRTEGALIEVIVKDVRDETRLNLGTRSVREFHTQTAVE